MSSKHDFLYTLIPIILSVIGLLFVLFVLIRLIMFILLFFLSRKYKMKRVKRIRNIREHIEKIDKKIQQKDVVDCDLDKKLQSKQHENIVGFAKPVGFWSSLLLGEKVTSIFDNSKKISMESSKQFWEIVAETQARESIKNKK